jgi:hypothetical protein
MFGKKKKTKNDDEQKDSSQEVSVNTIPDVFYGGKDPEIYHAKKQKNKQSKQKELVSKKKEEQKKQIVRPQVHTGQITKPTVKQKKVSSGGTLKKVFIIIIGCLIVLGAISAYYFRDVLFSSTKTAPVETAVPLPVVTVPDVSVVVPTVEVSTSTVEIVLEPPTSTPIQAIIFPNNIFLSSSDIDADELTDVEEEIFKTDSGTWDTDLDGYYDGQEIFNLYNPTGTAPEKIIDSGLVREYVNPKWQYRVYYPAPWKVDAVDDAANQVLISTITGEYIEIHAFQKNQGQSFISWFAKNATGQQYSDLTKHTNRFQVEQLQRKDGLVGYVDTDNIVFVLVYHLGVEKQILYPNVMRLMFQSFRPVRTFIDIPDQEILPEPAVATTTVSTFVTSTENIVTSTSILDTDTDIVISDSL